MLTVQQRAFVDARSRGLNGLEAARAAGYKGNDATLKVTASRLMKHPGVRAALEERAAATGAAIEAATADDPQIAGPVEQQRILTTIARSKSKRIDAETKIKAIVALSKIQLAVLPRQTGGGSSASASAQVVVVVDNGRGPSSVRAEVIDG